MKKNLLYFLIGSVFFAGIAYAAPTTIYQRSILPEVTNRYDLGTSSLKWSKLFANYASTTAINAASICIDGDSCKTAWPTTASGANPTGTIGLTAVNGSAATFLRSDGAPALSQAITPTWTGLHQFANATSTLFSATTAWITNGNITYASTTAINAAAICIDGDSCRTTWPSSATIDLFTHDSYATLTTSATTSALWTTSLLAASSTAFTQASTTLLTADTAWLGALTLTTPLDIGDDTNLAATYPIKLTGDAVSVDYGTTTANTWSLTQTFTLAPIFTAHTGVIIGNGASASTAGSAQTCTNQFVRSMSALYVATCASVSLTADVSGILPVANGGTGWANVTANNILFGNGANALATSSSLTFNPTTTLLTATNASSTNSSVDTNLWVNSIMVDPYKNLSITYSTSTWSGTTTVVKVLAPFNGTLKDSQCDMEAGTLNVHLYVNATAVTPMFNASSTPGTVTFTANNTFTKGDTIIFYLGTPATSPTDIRCTARAQKTS